MSDHLDRDLEQVFDEAFISAARIKEFGLTGRRIAGRPSRASLQEVKREARLRRKSRSESGAPTSQDSIGGDLLVGERPTQSARPLVVLLILCLLGALVVVASFAVPNRPAVPGGALSARFETTPPPVRTSGPSEPTPIELATAELSALFAGANSAWSQGPGAGLAYELAHDYPGAVDPSRFRQCATATLGGHPQEVVSLAPELSTATLVPVWVAGQRSARDWTFAGRQPQGATYLLVVDRTVALTSNGEAVTSRESIPVTILDGSAYLYLTAC